MPLYTIPTTPGVYGIYQVSQARWVYVGSSVNLKKRQAEHFAGLRHGRHFNKHLQSTWNKYGETDFGFVVLEECLADQVIAQEQYWLDGLKPTCNVGKCAKNSALGIKRSAETLAKMSKAMMGNHNSTGKKVSAETRAKLSIALAGRANFAGKHHSEETRLKMSMAAMGNKRNLGRKRSPETTAKMKVILTGRRVSPETRAKMVVAKIGKRLSPETRAKISTGLKGNKNRASIHL